MPKNTADDIREELVNLLANKNRSKKINELKIPSINDYIKVAQRDVEYLESDLTFYPSELRSSCASSYDVLYISSFTSLQHRISTDAIIKLTKCGDRIKNIILMLKQLIIELREKKENLLMENSNDEIIPSLVYPNKMLIEDVKSLKNEINILKSEMRALKLNSVQSGLDKTASSPYFFKSKKKTKMQDEMMPTQKKFVTNSSP